MTDLAFRRAVLMSAAGVTLLAAEVFALRFDLPRHMELLKHVLIWGALPFAILMAFGRSPMGNVFFKQQFLIRPFTTMRSKGEYNGSTIASLMYYEVISWQTNSKGGVEGRSSGYSMPSTNLELGGTKVSLNWLWAWLMRALTGRKNIIIEGLLMDVERPFKLKVWASNEEYAHEEEVRWREDGAPEGEGKPFNEALEEAVSRLAQGVLASIDPESMAEMFSARWRDDEAIALMSKVDNSTSQRLKLIHLNLEAEYIRDAERLLEKLGEVDDQFEAEALQYRTVLLMKQGHFAEAGDKLEAVCFTGRERGRRRWLNGKRHEFRAWLAETWAHRGAYGKAIDLYDRTLEDIAEVALSLVKDTYTYSSDTSSLIRLLEILGDHNLDGAIKKKSSDLLFSAESTLAARVRCRMLLREQEEMEPRAASDLIVQELDACRKALTLMRETGLYAWEYLDVQSAVRMKLLAQHQFNMQSYEGSLNSALEAVRLYEGAIPAYSTAEDRIGMNMQSVSSLAWCYHGQTACYVLASQCREEMESKDAARDGIKFTMRMVDILAPDDREKVMALSRDSQTLLEDGLAESEAELEANRQESCLLLRKSASLFGVAFVAAAPAQARDVMKRLKALGPADSMAEGEAVELRKMARDLIGSLKEEQGNAANTDVDRAEELTVLLYQQLRLIRDHKDRQDIVDWGESTEHYLNAERKIGMATTYFDYLASEKRRPAAEAAYGRAGIKALYSQAEEAAALLLAADKEAGGETCFYRNRVIFDEDFDGVRLDATFQTTLRGGNAGPATTAWSNS